MTLLSTPDPSRPPGQRRSWAAPGSGAATPPRKEPHERHAHHPRPRKASLFDAALNANWPAANDLSVGQINGLDSPLPPQPLTLGHVKPQLLGDWGTTPAQNLINSEREAT